VQHRSSEELPWSFATMDEFRSFMRWRAGRRPFILAHRGAPGAECAENSLDAYERAWVAAPCWAEVDIRTTRDGAFVLNHDATLDRCTTGSGPLAARTLSELRDLRLRDIGGLPTDQRMMTFDEAIDWARGRTVLFLDIKEGRARFADVLRHVRRRGAHLFCVTLTYAIQDTLAVHGIAPEAMVYGRATNEAFADELVGSGIPHDRLVAWIHDETPPSVFERLHAEGILTTYGTFIEVDRRAVREGFAPYHERLARGADILNSDDVPRAAAAIDTFRAAHGPARRDTE